jgi:glucose/mannose-6-phosphate isomerase
MFGILGRWPEQWAEATRLARQVAGSWEWVDPAGLAHIVVAGMGGSAIGGDLLRSYTSDVLRIPLIVSRSYVPPAFVGGKTLFIAASYSGDTEETLSAAALARRAGARVMALTSGGRLALECRGGGEAVISLPSGFPPRQALAYLFLPLLGVLQGLRLLPDETAALEETGRLLELLVGRYGPDRPVGENPAKALAASLFERFPVIYGVQDRTDAIALRWRGQFHENSKVWACANVLPELDHNEVTAFTSLPQLTRASLHVIFLEDREVSPRMARRLLLTRDLIAPQVAGVTSAKGEGESRLARIFSLVVLGDFVSCYLALLYGVDPLPVPVIEALKGAMAEGEGSG